MPYDAVSFFLILKVTFCANWVFMTLAKQLFYLKRFKSDV